MTSATHIPARYILLVGDDLYGTRLLRAELRKLFGVSVKVFAAVTATGAEAVIRGGHAANFVAIVLDEHLPRGPVSASSEPSRLPPVPTGALLTGFRQTGFACPIIVTAHLQTVRNHMIGLDPLEHTHGVGGKFEAPTLIAQLLGVTPDPPEPAEPPESLLETEATS